MRNALIGMISRCPSWVGDGIFALATAALVATVLGIDFLNSPNWPTGGDNGSHLLYAWLYADSLLFSGHVTPWVPETFGGLPFLSYYFPLPFIVIALLSKILGFAPAFKWGAFLAAMLLPGAVYTGSRRWLNFSWPAAFFGALGAFTFLLHEQNAIWGGNLLSTLAGEFAYSYGLLFAVLAMMAWVYAVAPGRGWVLAGVMEAACGFSHGFPLLVVGFSTVFLLLDCATWRAFRHVFGQLVRGHLLAFCLLGGWLWPMLEMHGLTIPNDAAFPLTGWRDLLPVTLWPALAAGVLGLALLAVPAIRRSWGGEQARALRCFIGVAGLAALAFIVGDRLGLADIRFFPLVWLFGAIACGWLFGQAVAVIGACGNGQLRLARSMIVASLALVLLGWLGPQLHEAPDWAQWNHAGLDTKPQWHNLSRLFPAMRGDLWSPRLLFEHDPANDDTGSPIALGAMPMFLNHRPVLEGLYMESAVLGPAIYQLQSEVSAQRSSPLVRFPTGTLDPEFAARHMNFLHADMLLLRSTTAKTAIEASALFAKIAESPPFALYRLKQFDSRLAQVVTQPLRLRPEKNWMEDAYAWFRSRNDFGAYLPVYGEGPAPASSPDAAEVREISLSRHEMVFETKAIGRPHLIKVAYHLRWQLASKGSLRIAAPGFMLVVPEEREIRLVFGHTSTGKLGMAATIIAAGCALFFGLRRRAEPVPERPCADFVQWRRWLPLVSGWGMLVAAGVFFTLHSPERAYNHAWELFRADRFEAASAQFLRAYQLRRPPAKKEEALFWLAKSSEQAGRHGEAKARYRELCAYYHGYWLPESLYNLAVLERLDGQPANAEPFERRLRDEYPANPWTRKLDATP